MENSVETVLDQFIDNDEAAEILGCSPKTLRVWVSQKKVPHYKVGRAVRFRRADLLEWLESRRVEPR